RERKVPAMRRRPKRTPYAWLQCWVQVIRHLLGRRVRLVRDGLDLRIMVDPVGATTTALPPENAEFPRAIVPRLNPARVSNALDDLKLILDQHPAARVVW